MHKYIVACAVVILLSAVAWFVGRANWSSVAENKNTLPAKGVSSPTPQKVISGIVVPHHDLVKSEREALFKEVSPLITQPKTIILLSPNHYESGKSDIQISLQTWDITDGKIEPNKQVIQSLLNASVASEEPESFANEHGVKLILADIKRNFPHAEIVPIIFKIKTNKEKITALYTKLKETCQDCFVVASVDFSHYQPALLANLHDSLTQRALENRDTDLLLTRAEVDSPPSLAFLAEWAKSTNTNKFVLKQRTNSGEMAKDGDIETTTHFFGWYEQGDSVKPKNSVSFLIGGDLMFDRKVAHDYAAGGLWKVFDKLGDRVFWGTDAGVANLEGALSEEKQPDDIASNNLTFVFNPETVDALTYAKFNGLSLANNHAANGGKKGLEVTPRLLKEANIQPIGGPGDDGIDTVGTFKGQGLTLHVIGVHTLASIPDLKPVIQKLKADPAARVIVFPHWGAEYIYKHGASQEQQAHAWIDAGADAVIGAHPHVIQDSELYKGKPILYSLGNFVFDQYFSKETQRGLFAAGEFTDDGLRLFALPIQLNKAKPELLRGEEKKLLLDRLYEPFSSFKQGSEWGDILFFGK